MLSAKEMDNIFITNCFNEWAQTKPSKKVELANKILGKLRFSARLTPPVNTGTMTSVEQRMNMFHLASGVLFYEVPGEFVELGCHAGQSAVIFQKIIEHYDKSRTLHVYDSFEGLPEVRPDDGNNHLSLKASASFSCCFQSTNLSRREYVTANKQKARNGKKHY